MIRWGILGAGNIAHRFAASLAHEPHSQLVAISGRSQEKLDAFAQEYGVAADKCYTNHASLIEDANIDAIYLALPHGLHKEWACQALAAGHAVLCEKPAALSEAEVCEIAHTAREHHSFFMEAMKPRFVPLHAKLRELLDEQTLGEVVSVQTQQLVHMDPARGGYMADPVQGGVLFDMGIYEVSWLEELLTGEVSLTSFDYRRNAAVDWYDKAELLIGGHEASLEVSAETGYTSRCHIACEEGCIDVDLLHRPTHATVNPLEGPSWEIDAPYIVDDFYGEISHVVECLLNGREESPLLPLLAIEREAHIIDIIRTGYAK